MPLGVLPIRGCEIFYEKILGASPNLIGEDEFRALHFGTNFNHESIRKYNYI